MAADMDYLMILPPEQRRIRAQCYHPTGTFRPFPRQAIERNIPARFEEMARLYPDRLAVKTATHSLTYATLNQTANRIAQAILARCGPDEKPVAILLHEGTAVVAAVLGALKAGKFFVVLDPTFPTPRLAATLSHAKAHLLITDTFHLPLAHELVPPDVALENIDALPSHDMVENPGLSLAPHRLAALVYTSGSTGEPTGVVYNHQGVLHLVWRLTNAYHICPEDRFATLASWSFAGASRYALCSLLNGAAVLPHDLKREGVRTLAAWLRQEQITITHPFPSTFRQFVSTLSAQETFPHLRLLTLGGEAVYKSDVALYQKHFAPTCIFVHVMGSTELSTTRMHFMDHQTVCTHDIVPPGYAVEDTDIILREETGSALSDHEVGEIVVKSRYLAVGYWGNAALTAATFLPDPAGGEERLYVTGDMGRMLPDSCLIHCGRKDFLLKIRGYRVNTSEIETLLLQEAAIQEAAVVGRAHPSGEQCLVAYVVPSSPYRLTVPEIRHALAKVLPDYMIPTAFVMLETLPRTPNSKVDRRALPAPEWSRPVLDVPYVAPRTPVEQALATMWAEVLHLEQVGIHDPFLDLGGHSLLATQILTRIITTFRVELPLRTLLDAPTVAEMAVIIAQHQAAQGDPQTIARLLAEVEAMAEH